jgi:hypothetical protein
LGGILADSVAESPRSGRPRLDDPRRLAEACLFRHYHSRAPQRNCFGWNELPDEFGCSPATANRRFRTWLASGAWECFWDALLDLRLGTQRGAEWAAAGGPGKPNSLLDSPVQAIVAELERAFCFFNARFFGNSLPRTVLITLEDRRFGKAGFFCAGRWCSPQGQVSHHLMVSTLALGRGKEVALEVLLHEMVHYRNHQVGVVDCSAAQYHNRHFRDAATLAGLECSRRDPTRGYGATRLGPRGRQAVADFQVGDEGIFALLAHRPTLPPLGWRDGEEPGFPRQRRVCLPRRPCRVG